MSAHSDAVLEMVLDHEGGFIDHPADKGGPTNLGISTRTYPDEDIEGMTRERAKFLLKRDFWDELDADNLPPKIAASLVDFAVNSSSARAVRWFQRAMGRRRDDTTGKMDDRTLREMRILVHETSDAEVSLLLNRYRKRMQHGTVTLDPSQGEFIDGWLNRTDDVDEFNKETP